MDAVNDKAVAPRENVQMPRLLKTAAALHDAAMVVAEETRLHAAPCPETSHGAFLAAFQIARLAAMAFIGAFDQEPTRSTFFRDAAQLGMDCERFQEAEMLARLGIDGSPDESTAGELWEVLRTASARLHLAHAGTNGGSR